MRNVFLSVAPALALILALACPALLLHAHEGEEHQAANKVPKFPSAIMLPALDGPRPWSDKPLLDDPDRFQIAIVTDHTGGHRPGVWMKAVERLNHLRPSFVMSVGDLIEGYSEDPAQIENEWTEFLGFVDKMRMRFFFVAGNHDVSNPRMHEIWRKHFGVEWYSFDYKGVHFVCLSSEDINDQVGPQQLQWLEEDLRKHADARWTLLFLHKPLWVTAERNLAAGNSDATNWKQVESLLGSRPHTVFAGHVHHYVQYDRRGMKYYHLATTGGSSQLRGVDYGEFDHIVWLTMESDGPTVANLLLDGIYPSDAVTESGLARFRDFLDKTRIEIAPILVDDDAGVSHGRVDLRLTNQFDLPVEVSARIEGLPLRGLTLSPAALNLQAGPGESRELAVDIRFGETIAFQHLADTLLTARIRATGGDRPLSAERTIPVVIDRRYDCPAISTAVVLDGMLSEWNDLPFKTVGAPTLLGPREQWQGSTDASMTFAVSCDDGHLYIAARIIDDSLRTGDQVLLRMDARPIDARKADSRLRTGSYALTIPVPAASAPAAAVRVAVAGSPAVPAASVSAVRAGAGWQFEAAIPAAMFIQAQGANWQGFQLTPILSDVDDASEKPVEIVWRGTSDVHQRNVNYGQFQRTAAKRP